MEYYFRMDKKVLIIDAPPLFREFLREKLSAEKITVDIAQGDRDAFTKLVSGIPDLVIINVENFNNVMEFLGKKHGNPNCVNIPVILSGPKIERELLAKLPLFHVVKYFNKPIQFDIFFEAIGRILKTNFSLDITPCILELHLNDNIIFVELAQGLNREKIALLKYRISEMVNDNKLAIPKLVLMMTDLSLTFVDGANLEYLLDTVISDTRILRKNVKILSLDSFTKDLINGHKQYEGIEVVENLSAVLNSLVDSGTATNVSDVIADKILTATEDNSDSSVQIKFHSESGVLQDESSDSLTKKLKIAIVDDDKLTLQLLSSAFSAVSIQTESFNSGSEFLAKSNRVRFDLAIIDIFMPGLSGFDILSQLQSRQSKLPVMVYSSRSSKELVIKAMTLGAKSYQIKPLKPEELIQKALDVINNKI